MTDDALTLWHGAREFWRPQQQPSTPAQMDGDTIYILDRFTGPIDGDTKHPVSVLTTLSGALRPSWFWDRIIGREINERTLFQAIKIFSDWPDGHQVRAMTVGCQKDMSRSTVPSDTYVLADGTLIIEPFLEFVWIDGHQEVGEIRWTPDGNGLMSLLYLHPNSKFEDLRPIWDVLRYFGRIIDARNRGGRHRIGDDPSDGELSMARQAERIRQEHPTWTWKRIVHKIRLVEAIEDEGRSRDPEAAALERLRRWRKRLRESGE